MSQQSQTDFLLEVEGWTQEKCLNNLDAALPTLLNQLESAAFIEDGIRTLKVLCDYLLPCVRCGELEKAVFGKIGKHTSELIDGSLSKILQNVTNNSGKEKVIPAIEESLQWALEIGLCLESCLRTAANNASPPAESSISLSAVQSLPELALHYLKRVYDHCKGSSQLYGKLVEMVSAALSALFKKAHSVQMLLLGLLDKICVDGLEQHVVTLSAICTGLFDVCTLVTSLDVKLSISLWKAITRLCSQHLSLLRDRLEVCPFVSYLCDEIREGYLYLFRLSPQADHSQSLSQGDDKIFSKSVRIVGFQMKVLVALLRDFADYLGESEACVFHLLIFLHRHLPPSLDAPALPEKQEAELRAHVVNATVPCLTHLMGNRAFRGLCTRRATDDDPSKHLPKLLLQLMVLDILPRCDDEIFDEWFQPVAGSDKEKPANLLLAIFSSARKCRVEMKLPAMLPGVVAAGQPHRQVNLYEHTVTHICGLVGACPARLFKTLESVLLSQVLETCDLVAMMAVDCWCFLVRYGTACVCNSQVRALVSVYSKLVSRRTGRRSLRSSGQRLEHLLSRLIKFMSPEHQAALVQTFPPESHPALWLGLQPSGLSADLAKDVTARLVEWSLSVLRAESRTAKASSLFLSLQLLEELIRPRTPSEGPDTTLSSSTSPPQQSHLLRAVLDLWGGIRTSAGLKPSVRQKLLRELLPVTSRLLHLMDASDLITVVQSVEAALNTPKCSADIAYKVARFLSGFSHVKLGGSFMDGQVLEVLPRLFHRVLKHPHPMVHQQALVSFSRFASLTPHEETVPTCLMEDEGLTKAVQDFINQVPHQSTACSFSLLDYLKEEERRISARERPVCEKDSNTGTHRNHETDAGFDSDDDLFDERPVKKRRTISESEEEPSPPQHQGESEARRAGETNGSNGTAENPLLEQASNKEVVGEDAPSLFPALAETTAEAVQRGSQDSAETVDRSRHNSGADADLRSLVGRVSRLARDIAEAKSAGHGDLPQWFKDRCLIELEKCKSSLYDSQDWLNQIS